MNMLRPMLLSGLLSGVAGCAIHPLPDDVTRETSFTIAKKIRCEAQEAVREQLISELPDGPLKSSIASRQMKVADAIELYRANPAIVTTEEARKKVERFRETAIAFGFRFDITENNDESITLGLKDTFTDGLFTMSLVGGNEKKRQAVRTFTYADSFEELFTELKEEECVDLGRPGSNFIYPITGKIGLSEVVDTYIELEESGADFNIEKNKFVDTITFRTRFFGELTPKIELTPITTDLHVTDITGSIKPNRIDEHEVAITITPPAQPTTLPSAPRRPAVAGVPRRPAAPAPAAESAKARAVENLEEEERLTTDRELRRFLDQFE